MSVSTTVVSTLSNSSYLNVVTGWINCQMIKSCYCLLRGVFMHHQPCNGKSKVY